MISFRQEGDGFIVEIQGRIINEAAPEFHEKMLTVIDQNPGKCLMDLSKVDYICSSGIGTIAHVLKKLRDRSDDLFLFGLNDTLETLFRVTRLSRIIEVVPDLNNGIGRLHTPPLDEPDNP